MISWLDFILDKINEFGIDNISSLEREYLENYNTDKGGLLEKELNLRFEIYENMLNYTFDEEEYEYYFDYPTDFSSNLNMEDCGLSLLWDNLDLDEMVIFMRIYGVNKRYLDYEWEILPANIIKKFKHFIKKYLKLKIEF